VAQVPPPTRLVKRACDDRDRWTLLLAADQATPKRSVAAPITGMCDWKMYLVAVAMAVVESGCGDVVPNAPPVDPVSVAIRRRLEAPAPDSISQETWTSVSGFYQARHDALAWFNSADATTAPALQVLRSAPDHGLDPAPYGAASPLVRSRPLA
jgi:hypothetical protein